MNDPSKTPIDIEEQRTWLHDFRQKLGSLTEVAKRIGIGASTVGLFINGKYEGRDDKVAEAVFRYRQTLAAHRAIEVGVTEQPGYFETETSNKLIHMLSFAQKCTDVAVAAMGPGNSKTEAAKHFKNCFSNVFLATMSPSASGINTMQIAVLKAMGYSEVKGTPQKLTQMIVEKCASLRNPLIIMDEAQHLSGKSFDEARSWNDEGVVGLAIFGNAGVLKQLEGASRQSDFAQLYSRIGLRVEQLLPLGSDVEAFATAWGVYDRSLVTLLKKVCLRPGGLRNGTKVMKLAHMLAAAEGAVLAEAHIGDAWAQLSSRTIGA
jgi:DNA transposition AAA+ family ATPase